MAGRARGLTIRGRGPADFPPVEHLRRPGDLTQPNSVIRPPPAYDVNAVVDLDDILKELNIGLVNDDKLLRVADSLKSACSTSALIQEAVEKVYQYCLLNKMNAHYGALLSTDIADHQAGGVKFKYSLFSRLQQDYKDRTRKYTNLDQFLNIVVALCEIYHHLRISDGTCYEALAIAVIEYFGMLVEGGSEKEIETFMEQVAKCGKNLQSQQPTHFENLVHKIRKQIVGISSVSCRSMLLRAFEMILNHWGPLGISATTFYNAICKQITSACE